MNNNEQLAFVHIEFEFINFEIMPNRLYLIIVVMSREALRDPNRELFTPVAHRGLRKTQNGISLQIDGELECLSNMFELRCCQFPSSLCNLHKFAQTFADNTGNFDLITQNKLSHKFHYTPIEHVRFICFTVVCLPEWKKGDSGS